MRIGGGVNMLNRLTKITGSFDELDKLTNIMYNLEGRIEGFKLHIHSIQQIDFENHLYEMIFSIPCCTYYRGLREVERAVPKISETGKITITHTFKDTNCHIEFELNGNVKLYYKDPNDPSLYNSYYRFTVDWSKSFEEHNRVLSKIFNEFGYLFDFHLLGTTMYHINNYYNGNEERKKYILKDAWNIEIK